MIKKVLILMGTLILIISLTACSTTDKISDKDKSKSNKMKNEEILFEKPIVIVDNDMVKIVIKGKEKIYEGNSIGYITSVENKSDKSIKVIVDQFLVDGKEELNDFSWPIEPNTMLTTQMSAVNVKSLDNLKNSEGVFRVEINDKIKEYKFDLE